MAASGPHPPARVRSLAQAGKLVRLARLIKLLRVARSVRLMSKYETYVDVDFGFMMLMKFAVSTLIMLHWFSCVW